MLNSLIVSGSATVLVVIVSSMGGFAFAFYRFRGKETLFFLALSSVTIPGFTLVIPLFLTFSALHVIDTYLAVILPWGAWVFALFFMRVYIRSNIHPEIIDAARIDGASELTLFFRIVMPMIIPAVAVLAVMAFTQAFNDFFWPLIALRTPNMYTLPVGMSEWTLSNVVGQSQNVQWGLSVTGPLVSMIPMLVLFILMRKQFTKGLTFGVPKQ